MKRRFSITTPIYYVNAEPHIGHTYTTIVVDTLARYHRLAGEETFFLTGTDEHGEKVAEVAAQRGVSAQAFTEEISGIYRSTWEALGMSFDRFIRTTDRDHVELGPRHLDTGRQGQSAPVDAVESVGRHIAREPRRAADPGQDDRVPRFDLQGGHGAVERVEDAKITAARAPDRFEIRFVGARFQLDPGG